MDLKKHLSRPEIGFDLLRVYLGIGLIVRGGLVASDPAVLERFTGDGDWLLPMFTAHAVVLSHLVGGGLLALGLLTRWAAAIQVPTVAGALFLVHWHEGLFARTQSTEFAALVLVALVLYTIFGAGDLSVDRYIERIRVKSEARPLVPEISVGAAGPHSRTSMDKTATPATEGSALTLTPDSPRARELYRDAKAELSLLVTMMCILFVLLAKGFYIAATAWVIVSLFVFGIWRIGRAEFQ